MKNSSTYIPFVLTIFAFIMRFPHRFLYLEDWDSVQLALGLHDFSIAQHQPHPPGYPLYILLGKFFYLFTQNDTEALTLISSIFGALSIIPLFLLTRQMFGSSIAIFSSLLFIFIPVHWQFSEIALTDVPGLFFLILAALFIYNSQNNLKKLILSSLFSGLILGFRFNEIPIIIGLLLLINLQKGNLKYFFFSFGAFLIGIFLWLIPLIWITGLNEFINSYSSLAGYVIKHDVFLSQSLSFKEIIKTKADQLINNFNLSLTVIFTILSFLSILWIILKGHLKEFKFQFLLTWFISYLLALVIFLNLESTRHILPLLPPLVIFVMVMLNNILTNKKFFILIYLIILYYIALPSWIRINQLKNIVPPTIQPVYFVKDNFNPSNATILASSTYRQFQYYAPEFKVLNSDKISTFNVSANQIIIIDYLGLKDKLKGESLKKLYQKEFVGDKDIFTKISQVTLYIIKSK